uniref:Phosphatidylinositol N-acetylglucosaminyltransferase subunit Y n=1 Tax=Zea mays TaxID=4577 RepID=A0A804N7U1_MAIZE
MVSLSASIECLCRGNFVVALLLANASVSFPSLGDHHRLPCHSNVKSESAPASATFVSQPWSSPATSTHRRSTRLGNPEMDFPTDQLIGSAFIAFGLTLFVCFFYVAVVSKLLPPHQNGFLATIQNDWYYCLLVPLSLPVIIVVVYLHWLSMKMFKHA